jgi:DNA-binding HxlR family transcriptional regulator
VSVVSERRGYGQHCPIAIAAEIVAERWTPLLVRALCLGATHFNEIHESVPRMSSALLSKRLRELEYAGVIHRAAGAGGRSEYRLTEAGEALFPVLEAMGFWAQRWLKRDITREENLDPFILMWEIRRHWRSSGRDLAVRRVVHFHLDGAPVAKRLYWLVFEPHDIDICTRDPGFEIDLWITASIRTLVEIWLGHRSLDAAINDDALRLDGSAAERNAFRRWFALSHFARGQKEIS